MVEITDYDSAIEWLGTQEHQTQVWFASRCALRAFPGLGKWEHATSSGLSLLTCRAMLISAAAATHPDTEIEAAAKSAASATYSVAHSVESTASSAAVSTAYAAARSADSMDSEDSSADSAARSAAASSAAAFSAMARSAAWDAASVDANAAKNWEELWHNDLQPEDLKMAWSGLKTQWEVDDADWSFWIEWYEAVLNGKWTNWELIFRIARTFTDEDWDKGAGHVAERIAGIRKDLEPEPLDQDALQTHVRSLAQYPVLNADIARSAGQQIESIIKAFKTEAPANQLPDGFEAFEKMPPTFLAISAAFNVTSTEAPDRAVLQKEINRLHGVIAQLRSDLHEAKLRLLETRLTAAEAQQIRTFGERAATTLTSIVSLGVIAGGMAWFFGVPEDELRYDALKERLNGLVEEMENAQPSPDTDTLRPATEV